MPIQRTLSWLAVWATLSAASVAQDEKPPDEKPAESTADRAQQELLDRILNNVSKARDSLKESATQPEARPLQKQVVTDLETLIDMLKQNQSSPPPEGSGGSQSNSQSDNSQSKQQQKQKSSQNSQTEKQKSQSQAESEDQQDRNDTDGSEERHGEMKAAERRAQRQQRLEDDIWGHLPPKLREQLLNTYGERMLPQYEEFVRKFYDALSEPKQR